RLKSAVWILRFVMMVPPIVEAYLHLRKTGSPSLKQEVGLAHFEGRSWQGLHHHAVLCMVALTFLQWLRLTQPDDLRGETVPAIRAEVAGTPSWPPRCLKCLTCTALFSGP
ncbi:hypothetical protein FNU79_18875, partial [Deinococcus detaillensis]